jgi:adenylate cyclase
MGPSGIKRVIFNSRKAMSCGSFFLLLGVFLWLWQIDAFSRFENLTWSIRVNALLDKKNPSQDIVIILLDQASLEWGSQAQGWEWPWPRSIYGHIIDHLQKSGAKSITLDLLFTEGSPYPGEDQAFGESIKGSSPVYTAMIIDEHGNSGSSHWPKDVQPFGLKAQEDQAPSSRRAIFPISGLSEAFHGFGDVMAHIESAGFWFLFKQRGH